MPWSRFPCVIVLALAVISQVAARAYGEPTVGPLLLAASPTVLMIGTAGVSTALLRRQLAYRALAIRTVLGVIAGGTVGITMALNEFGAWSLVGQRLTEVGINSVLSFIAAGWRPKQWPRRARFCVAAGARAEGRGVARVDAGHRSDADRGARPFAEPRAAGLFAFAWRFVEIVRSLIVRPLQGVAQSAIAAMRRKRAATNEFLLDLSNLAAWATFPAFVGLALIAGPLIHVLLGDEWEAAGVILPILCISGAVSALTGIQEAYLLAIDRIDAFVRASAFEAAVGIVIVAVASQYGPVAAAGAVVLRSLVALPLRTSAALAPERIAPMALIGALAAPVAATAAMALPMALWRIVVLGRVSDLIFLTSAVAVGVAAVFLLLFGLMPNSLARLRTFLHASADSRP